MAESTTQHFTRNASTQQRPHNDHRKDHSRRIEEDKAKTTEIQSNFTYVNQSGILKIFMATVAHGIKTMKAANLLDDGRSNTFCTLNLAQKLQLSTTSHQRLSISHFGSADKTDRCHNISPITLKQLKDMFTWNPLLDQILYTEISPALRIQIRTTAGQAYCGTSQQRNRNRLLDRIRLLLLSGKRWNHPTKQWNVRSRNQSWISCLWWPTWSSTDWQLLHNSTNSSHWYRQRTYQRTTADYRMDTR